LPVSLQQIQLVEVGHNNWALGWVGAQVKKVEGSI